MPSTPRPTNNELTEENVAKNFSEESSPLRDSGDYDFKIPNDQGVLPVDEMRKPAREVLLEEEIVRLKHELKHLKLGMSNLSAAHSDVETGTVTLEINAEDVDQVLKEACDSEAGDGEHKDYVNDMTLSPSINISVIKGSALAKSRVVQAIIYLVALSGVAFVLGAKATKLGYDGQGADAAAGHRRLGAGPSLLLTNIAFCVAGAGAVAFFVNLLKQPLILGYLLGGILVGPIGLQIVHSHHEIAEISSLGLVFLLFMIGLELDVSELMKMGKVVLVTGLLQFPVCVGLMTSIFMGLETIGLSFGSGQYATLYCGMTCGISSTMIVVKLLSEQAEMDSLAGRLTVGILIFQDIWAIVVLAIQPDLANPQIVGLLKTFGMIAILVVVALAYAKFVMPAVFMLSSRSVELMLVVALAWCFFMCCFATLPFIGLSMELAALISGVALATFPYSAEFNGKIKYIRDFFITLFFVGLGMQIPVPSFSAIGMALIIGVVVLAVRWIGIFGIVWLLGGGKRLATVSTINLSEISEFALVICSLGVSLGHVDEETLTILIWTFSFLAILASYLIPYNYRIYGFLSRGCKYLLGRKSLGKGDTRDDHEHGGDHVDRNIIILGFHKTAAQLIAHFEHYSPCLLAKIHVIDFHEHIMPELRQRGVTCAYGDISSPDVLEHAHHGDVRLVISSIPDSLLRGVTNARLLQISKQVWPQADVIVTATTPDEAHNLYDNGADYVLRVAKLCAERLHDVILDHSTHAVHHHHLGEETKLSHVFEMRRAVENVIPRTHTLIRKVAQPDV